MSEENKWVSVTDNPLYKWVMNVEKRQQALNTITSFAIALVVYTAVQGFTNPDFSIVDLFTFVGMFVAIASGFGVMAVQNDAINKAIIFFENTNELFKKYNDDNIDKAYKVRDSEYQRQFTKQLNDTEFRDKVNAETVKKGNMIKNELFKINNLLTTMSKAKTINKLNKRKTLLEHELKDIEENGVNPQFVDFTMYEPSDIFSFNDGETQYGADKVKDTSKQEHIKKNLWSRIYIPIIMTIVTSGLLFLLGESLKQTLIQSGTFLITLLWVWYSTYTKHISMKNKKTIPAVINRNTLLTDAEKDYNKPITQEPQEKLKVVKTQDNAYTIEDDNNV